MKMLNRLIILVACGLMTLHGSDPVAHAATTLPRQAVKTIVVEEAMAQGVPADLALAVAEAESGFATLAISPKGARGVMQLMPRTARDLYGLLPYELFDARTNIRAGVDYLGSLMDRYGRVDLALSHYNGGSAVRRPDGPHEVIPATRRYVEQVLSRRRHYAEKYLALRGEGGAGNPSAVNWRAAASGELAALSRERQRIVNDLRRLTAENMRRSRHLREHLAFSADAEVPVSELTIQSTAR